MATPPTPVTTDDPNDPMTHFLNNLRNASPPAAPNASWDNYESGVQANELQRQLALLQAALGFAGSVSASTSTNAGSSGLY